MRFLSSLFKDNATRKSDFEKWMETATKEELSAAYEKKKVVNRRRRRYNTPNGTIE